MIAAIYARKSTEQNGVSEAAKSVTRQIEQATVYAARKGWAVSEAHVYVDDGISGAEFASRPGFVRLMNALKPRSGFGVLIMSEESRLGREQIETSYALKQVLQAGVRVFYYLEDRERTLGSPTDKLLLSVTAFADELEREQARQRTYDAMSRKAQAGYVAGGQCFGYDNVEVFGPDGKRSHVERRINETEAAVVRRVFELAAAGYGKKRIAVTLNDAGAPSPRAQRGRPGGWAPSSVFEVLARPVYRGEIVWNATRKRDAWGRQAQKPRPESEWLRVPAPHLQIVPDDLWRGVEVQAAASRAVYLRRNGGATWGRPSGHFESKYLLSGLGECGCCRGGMLVKTRPHGRRIAHRYGCSSYAWRGKSVCANGLDATMTAADDAVLSGVAGDLLTPRVIGRTVDLVFEAVEAGDDVAARVRVLQAELEQVEGRLRNLTAAIAAGGELASLLVGLAEQEETRRRLRIDLAEAEGAVGIRFDARSLRREVHRRVEDWRGLLTKHVAEARPLLRRLLDGRITFTPKRLESGDAGYEVRGRLSVGSLFSGLFSCSLFVASPKCLTLVERVGGRLRRAA